MPTFANQNDQNTKFNLCPHLINRVSLRKVLKENIWNSFIRVLPNLLNCGRIRSPLGIQILSILWSYLENLAKCWRAHLGLVRKLSIEDLGLTMKVWPEKAQKVALAFKNLLRLKGEQSQLSFP